MEHVYNWVAVSTSDNDQVKAVGKDINIYEFLDSFWYVYVLYISYYICMYIYIYLIFVYIYIYMYVFVIKYILLIHHFV